MIAARTRDKGNVLRVLKNPLYAGLIQSRGALHKGEHPPLVGKDGFDRVQAMLATKCTVVRDEDDTPVIVTRNPEYLLADLLWCPNCGHAYTTATTSKGGRQYRYYRAVSQVKRGHGHCTCGHIPAPAIEGYVFRRIREACQNGNLAEEVAARAKEKLEARRQAVSKVPVDAESGQPIPSNRRKPTTPTILRDPRLPPIGTVLTKKHKADTHQVTIHETDFEWDGRRWASLSKIAYEITGTKWNGLLYFGLAERKPAQRKEAAHA